MKDDLSPIRACTTIREKKDVRKALRTELGQTKTETEIKF